MAQKILDAARVREFREAYAEPQPKTIVVLVGPPGCGLTTLVREVAAGDELIFLADFSPEFVAKAAGTRALTGKRKVLVVDEFEMMTAQDVAVMSKVPRGFFVCIAHSTRGRSGTALPKTAKKIVFPKPTADAILALLPPGPKPWAVTAAAARGDVRATMREFAGICRIPESIPHTQTHADPAWDPDDLAVARAAMRGEVSVEDAVRHADASCLSACFESLPEKFLEVRDWFSACDVMTRDDEEEEIDRLSCTLPVAAVSMCAPGTDLKKTFGTLWSAISRQHAKHHALVAIRTVRETAGLWTQLGVEDLAVLRGALLRAGSPEEMVRLARRAGFHNATDLLAVIRMFPSGYTSSMHARVKKAFG